VKLFLSYSRADAGNFARHIHRYFIERGHAVFIDVNSIRIGEPWARSIEKNISECDIFVVILTPDSLTSKNVEREVLQAKKEEKIIVPCIHEYVPYNQIKWGLKNIQGIEFSDKFELALHLYPKITTSLSTSIEDELENIRTRKEKRTKNTKSILNELENIRTRKEKRTKNTKSILNELENIEKNTMDNFSKIQSDTAKFNLEIPIDRLLFYLRLLEYLTNSNESFLNQNRIKLMLANSLRKKRYPISNIGYDEIFYNAHPKMNDEENKMFNFLRRTTEDSKLLNSFARKLLQDNREIFTDMAELKILYEHYSYWLAKYELLKNDPDMCLVYVGPKQKKHFPVGIESRINEKIKALREETLMQDIP
jgi:hypothetical protein